MSTCRKSSRSCISRPSVRLSCHRRSSFRRWSTRWDCIPIFSRTCQKLFKDGHINESVRKALEKYETYIQQKSALTRIGTDLMANAFNEDGPAVKVADVTTDRGKGLQMGFEFISMGAMSFWRNLCSHGDEQQMPHQDAVAILATVSHLLHTIDRTP
jgi:uncharacterized protein (TIGR02391 family)